MDIIAVSTATATQNEASFCQQDYNSKSNTQNNNDHWDQADCTPEHSFLLRTKSCPTRPTTGGQQNLFFARHYSIFSAKGLEEEPGLSMQLTEYNRKHNSLMRLDLNKEDQVYSGLLQFQYFDGNEMRKENVHVKSSDSIANLIPILKSTFIASFTDQSKDYEMSDGENHSYVALVQGEMERELDMMDKPLEIALDCSSKGLASPKFLFKSPLSEQTDTPLMARQTNRFTSYVGSLALPSGSENEESPTNSKHLKTFNRDFDQTSMTSFGSAFSLSSKSSKTKSTSSLVVKSKKKKLAHTLSNQETAKSNKADFLTLESSAHHQSQTLIDSPVSTRKNGNRKSIMTNFISRSLRIRKKHKRSKDTTNDSPDGNENNLSQNTTDEMLPVSSLISPLPADRRFTLSTVMHIYYMKPKQVQLYKSVLVSEKATTEHVITQALERYNMKYFNPDDFGLYEVIGKWQEIAGTLPSNSSLHVSSSNSGTSLTLPNKHGTSPLVNRRTAVEEFVVCYSRELNHEDCPYNSQFFLDTREGYTRRFELRQKPSKEVDGNRKESTVSASAVEAVNEKLVPESGQRSLSIAHINCNSKESPVIFGQTTHRKRARRNRIKDSSASLNELSEELKIHDDEERKNTISSSTPADQRHKKSSLFTCSSPENKVGNGTHCCNDVYTPVPQSPQSEMAPLDTPILLNLRIHEPRKEKLVHVLSAESTHIVGKSSCKTSQETPKNDSEIVVCQPEIRDSTPLCSICRHHPISNSTCFEVIAVNDLVPVMVNGETIQQKVSLVHGDLISIGATHMFLFQNFSCQIPNYRWEPQCVEKSSVNVDVMRPSSQLSISSVSSNDEPNGKLTIRSGALGLNSRSTSEFSLTVEDVDSQTLTEINLGSMSISDSPSMTHSSKKPIAQCNQSAHTRLMMRQMNENTDRETITMTLPTNSEGIDNKTEDTQVFLSESKKQPLKKSSSLPFHTMPRKLMFSYSLNEEDALLTSLVSQFSSPEAGAQLGPSFALSMCIEYGMMCYGQKAMTAFIKKATSLIQSKAWELCKNLSEWQIDTEKAKKPVTVLKELFAKLEAVLLLLANTLELYYFITTNCRSLNFSEPVSPPQWKSCDQEQVQGNHSVLLDLYNVLVYTFQQAFYSVSKVLYHALPVILGGCTEDKLRGKPEPPIVIDQAVDFLQALFDLLTKVHIHLEVVSQFFANVFFFTNAVMFNALIEQGGDLSLYQCNSGLAMRANLDLLEGWACQVGFRDSVLHYLAKFSGAMDLLSSSHTQLLEMDWYNFRKEYPMLHPAQLHFILSNYLLPVSHVPSHWTPTQEDALHAVKTGSLKESFDHHPSFELPTSGYTIDLTKTSDDMEHLQPYLEGLRKQLKSPKRSVDIVPITESMSITSYVNDDSSESVPTPSHNKPYKVRKLLINASPVRARRNIGSNTESQEDLLEDTRNKRNSDNIEQKHNSISTQLIGNYGTNSSKRYSRKSGGEKIVDRVHSIVAPRSFKTPERFLLEPDGELNSSSWLKANFPLNAETVTIPRGERGFGFIMVEEKEKDSGNSENSANSAIFIQEVLPGSIAEKCSFLSSGDRILAIDGQLLDGADYIIADKYLKEAEDDVTLVVLRKERTHAKI